MPNHAPPADHDGEPVRWTLPAGTTLSRLHHQSWGPCDFNPTLADRHWGGGRFDATEDNQYGYLCAGDTDAVAVSETLLRDVPMSSRGYFLLPAHALAGRRMGWLRSQISLELVSLRSGADLAAVAQDSWLVQAPSGEYCFTRRWGHAIRRWAPAAAGLVWHSRREPDGLAYVLFDDRCPPGSLVEVTTGTPVPVDDSRLDSGAGRIYVMAILERYRVTVHPA